MDCRRSRTTDPDAWVATCPEFSGSMCEALREMMLNWQPDFKESINSNMLCFSMQKRVVALAAFNRHAEICFYRGSEVADPAGLLNHGEGNLSIRGIKLTTLEGLNVAALRKLVQSAVALDHQPALPPPKAPRQPWPMPPELAEGLKENVEAGRFFASLKPTYQREYMVWVGMAKRPETKVKRLEETLRALAAGRKWVDRKKV